MLFEASQSDLADLLVAVRKVTSTKTNPVFGFVHLALGENMLTATGTDGETTVESKLAVAQTSEPSVGLLSTMAVDYIKSLPPGKVSVRVSDDEAVVRSAVGEVSFRTQNAADFPAQQWPDGPVASMPALELIEAIDAVKFAAADESSRPAFAGVLFRDIEGVRNIVATDTFKLAVKTVKNPSGGEIDAVIPAEALKKLRSFLSAGETVGYVANAQAAVFTVGDVRLRTRLIVVDYPNWKGVIPQSPADRFTVDRAPLNESLRRLLSLSSSKVIRFEVTDGELLLRVDDNAELAKGCERVAADVAGAPEAFSLNGSYLSTALGSLGEKVEFAIAGSIKPVLLTSPDDASLQIVQMPIRSR